ncbi:MAG TPA: histidinol-phosphate transaminase [Edaphobacter sp.]|uniref:histidinol-phosphate transaminase n=1 Tax=Edaphobacter sp. TaxID=1934404 RepID=UPI002CB68422|nr:histidinol-phosphate transaminase [Edaphobacter sp.]HUZ93975.1 histidinol-phosphate transaminase [Edaphobacter sp.]
MSVTTEVNPRRAVLQMPEYHPPLAGRDALRLDFNENTFAPSPKVIERLREITAEGLTKYPEREPGERIAAKHFGLKPEEVLLTNGVDEAIHLVCCAFLEEGDEAVICTPGFFMYDVSVMMMTPNLRKVQADETLQFPFEKFLAAITERTKLIIVSSPNNPTGAVVSREHLLALAKAAPQAVLMVDEAYFHFHGESTMGDLSAVPNMLVARTFSKAYGLANLRIGMLAGNAALMKYVRKVSSPYNVNGVALDCLTVALADEDYLAWYVEQVRVGRDRMMRGLDELGVPYFPSHANFVLMKIGPKHKDLVTAMREHGVLLRDRSADPGCNGFVRITIGIEEHVRLGLAALRSSLEEIGWKPAEGDIARQSSEGEREFE